MKIYHYQRRDRIPNFGDELNQWLWRTLLPDFFDRDEETVFVGIGTVLNNALDQRIGAAKRVIVFSSGVGYESALQFIPVHWEVHCVRGPLTAKCLRLPGDLAITDGAVLLSHIWQPSSCQKTAKFAFMPHVHHAVSSDKIWQAACDALNIRYIDPRWPVHQVLQQIYATEVLITEAMHGAIAADALRIPWISVVTSPRILQFKWQDWCASMHLPYRPRHFLPLSQSYLQFSRGVRSSWKGFKHWSVCVARQPNMALQSMIVREDERQAIQSLQQIARTSPQLSQQQTLSQRVEQLLVAIGNIAQ